MTVQEALKRFIRTRKLKGLSNKTIEDYEEFIYLFVRYIGFDTNIFDLTQDDIERYIEYQVDRNITRNTLATYIRHFKIFIRWLCDNFEVGFTYKTISVPRNTKKNVRLYSDNEIKQIFDNIEGSEKWILWRNKAIISFMLDSGLRQNEVCTLKADRIFQDTNRMTIYGKGDKERIVPVGKQSLYFYNEYRKICPHESIYAFVSKTGEQMSTNAVKLMVTNLSKKLSFPISSHKLRHNFATNYCLDMYYKYGSIDIYRLMILLGHEDISTTRRYLHLANEIIASSESLSHVDKVYSNS